MHSYVGQARSVFAANCCSHTLVHAVTKTKRALHAYNVTLHEDKICPRSTLGSNSAQKVCKGQLMSAPYGYDFHAANAASAPEQADCTEEHPNPKDSHHFEGPVNTCKQVWLWLMSWLADM